MFAEKGERELTNLVTTIRRIYWKKAEEDRFGPERKLRLEESRRRTFEAWDKSQRRTELTHRDSRKLICRIQSNVVSIQLFLKRSTELFFKKKIRRY